MKSQYVILINSIKFFKPSFQTYWIQHGIEHIIQCTVESAILYVFASGWIEIRKTIKWTISIERFRFRCTILSVKMAEKILHIRLR